MSLASKLFKGDRVIWIIFMFLCLISVVEVFSATSTLTYKLNTNHWAPVARHASFLMGGFVLVFFLHNIPCRLFPLFIFILPVSIVMLIVTPFIGVNANDAHRWLEIFGIQFQPSEFAKLSCIVFVAFMLSKRNLFTENQIFNYLLGVVSVTCALIFPENFSTAVMLFGVCFLMMFIGQLPLKKLAKLAGVLMLGGMFFVLLLRFVPTDLAKQYLPDRFSTWQGRLDRFFEPGNEEQGDTYKITDDNYQVSHAKIAIARGGIFGQLPGHGQQRDFLPQAYSDFIYAIIIEELGIVGGVFVLLLYIMLLVRVGMIARKCDKLFPKFLVLGCGLLVVVQALANMAVAVDLIPVTGQPMPLVSRGGTSTVISCIYFGIILSVSRFGAGMGEEDIKELPQEVESVQKELEEPIAAVAEEELTLETEI